MIAESPGTWQFARRPRWLLSHVLVAALLVAMVFAGFWQIDRHRERADRNDIIRERAAIAAAPLIDVAPPGAPIATGEAEQFRRVVVTGRYQPEDEVLVRNRTLDGSPGYWVLTPLLTNEGWAVAVNRGWIASGFDPDQERPGTEAPGGEVTVTGWIQPSRAAEGFQREDPAEGVLNTLARPNVERLGQQLAYDLAPVVLRVEPDPNRPSGQLPIPLSLPPLDGGSHASYAVQWFVFSAIAIFGYPLVLRRVATGKAGSAPAERDVSTPTHEPV